MAVLPLAFSIDSTKGMRKNNVFMLKATINDDRIPKLSTQHELGELFLLQ